MNSLSPHSFHIPVLGLGFTVDTPVKLARFGISSVISIVEDELIERMRQIHAKQQGWAFTPIDSREEDARARRIRAYLDQVHRIVQQQMETLQQLPFEQGNDLVTYFELLPPGSPLKERYERMLAMAPGVEKETLQQELRLQVRAGAIDVNIMSKVNKQNYAKDGTPLPKEFNDALTALRGFAQSTLESSVVFSAGYNPELYGYAEAFDCFMPDAEGRLYKQVILKVSDYRSALTQGKVLAKKGIWVSEFRIESGLNCGGHAFATDGMLLGPVMEEFRQNREVLEAELLSICNAALAKKERPFFAASPGIRLTVQGGIGTASEHRFLLEYYGADSAGWGSPFLLVPEATNVEQQTLEELSTAAKDDFYLSNASPLGVPFYNFRKSSSEKQRQQRIAKNRPGSPCYKMHLVSNTQFTERPICTASRRYQHLKIRELEGQNLQPAQKERALKEITDKDCLCEGLSVSGILRNGEEPAHKLSAVLVCPGPNLAFFSGIFTLRQMVDHIYGRTNLLNTDKRPNMFVNELELYLNYFRKEVQKLESDPAPSPKVLRNLATFRANLFSGIDYYKNLLPHLQQETPAARQRLMADLENMEESLETLTVPA